MRTIPMLLLVLIFFEGKAQEGNKWHVGFGLTGASLNFQQNGAAGLAIPIRYDFLSTPNSSFSLGTNIKIGSEDEYSISFPVIAAFIVLADAAGANPDLSDLPDNSGKVSHSSYSVNFFGDFPLLLNYNWGLGSNDNSLKTFGWYIGGGVTYTMTGVSLNSSGYAPAVAFPGWTGNIGIRLSRNIDIGFSLTKPMQNTVGPIQHPLMFSLTISAFDTHRGH
jgi:hypothetical protein